MTPTIVLKLGRPWLVANSLGATRILTGVLKMMINMIDFGMASVEAVSAPRIYCDGEPARTLSSPLRYAVHP